MRLFISFLVLIGISQFASVLPFKFHRYWSPITKLNANAETRLRTVVIDGKRQLESWFDECLVYVKGGSGGAGSNAYHYKSLRVRARPCGGNGGNGGSVIFTVQTSMNTLHKFRKCRSFVADNGVPGNKSFDNGANAKDLYVTLPLGAVVKVNETGEVLGELTESNQQLVVAKGGLGGIGNAGRSSRGVKVSCRPPTGGEKRFLKIELKMVADVGLLGVPNAGKSTLLSAMTRARPKIAPYPFTTLVPNLGVCYDDSEDEFSERSMIIADIPGLVEGASEGKGLGKAFLRHIERCEILIHLINGESADPVGDYVAINNELQLFSPVLAMKPQIVVLNKVDLPSVMEKQQHILNQLAQKMSHKRLLVISAQDRIGVEDLIVRTSKFLRKLKELQ